MQVAQFKVYTSGHINFVQALHYTLQKIGFTPANVMKMQVKKV